MGFHGYKKIFSEKVLGLNIVNGSNNQFFWKQQILYYLIKYLIKSFIWPFFFTKILVLRM